MNKRIALLFIGFVATAITSFYFLHMRHRHLHTEETDYIRPCQMNLQQMQTAKAEWASEEHKTTNDVPTWEDMVGKGRFFYARFTCSRGGIYTWGRVGEPVTCSIPGHTL